MNKLIFSSTITTRNKLRYKSHIFYKCLSCSQIVPPGIGGTPYISHKIMVKLHLQAFRQNFEYEKNAKIWFLFTRPLKIFFSKTTNSPWVCLIKACLNGGATYNGIQSDCRFPFCPIIKPQYQLAAVP